VHGHVFTFRFVASTVTGASNAFSRLNSSTARTTTTGRSYFVMPTGAALARSISSPKLFFASADVKVRIRVLMLNLQCWPIWTDVQWRYGSRRLDSIKPLRTQGDFLNFGRRVRAYVSTRLQEALRKQEGA
jgi:hypothetical protein